MEIIEIMSDSYRKEIKMNLKEIKYPAFIFSSFQWIKQEIGKT